MIFSSAPNDWLMHHGIKGQKWGIRRFQNPDGTLTAEGRRRYDSMSDKSLAKELKTQIKSRYKEVNGKWWNGFDTIGEHTKRFQEDREKAIKEYESSPEYKEWNKKVKSLSRKMESGTLHGEASDRADKEWFKLMDERPKSPDIANSIGGTVTFGGIKYFKSSYPVLEMKTIAQLQDLGYSHDTAKSLVDRLVKSDNLIDI